MNRVPRALTVAALVAAGALVPTTHATAAAAMPPTGLVCTDGTLSAGTRTFNLVANTGYIDTPDGNSVFMWSYGPEPGHFQSPGPALCATAGETVAVHLHNTLSVATSMVFPGQDEPVSASGGVAGPLATEVAPGASVTYSFTANQPGTYRYESGTNVAEQVEMGLYGALIIRPALGPAYAYDTASQFDPGREYLLLLSEIDPDLHHAVEIGATYNVNALNNRYFAINGREFPDTIQDNGSGLLPNQPYGSLVRIQPNTTTNPLPALVRMVNVGESNHPFHPHGNHTQQIAQDGRTIAPTEHFGETLGAGQTEDFLLRWDDVDNWGPVSNPLPVAQPNYRNLFFKDGNTWYAGSPYLGSKGTLPTGTNSQNVCGEWYFPWHSHALNEFTNYDQGFGGMATLLRVDPPGGCLAAPTSTAIVGGTIKSGTYAALAADDTSYYQVNPKTTTRTSATTVGQTSITVASASGFPPSGSYFTRIDNEVLQVTGGQGTTTWTVSRGQLGTSAATHANNASVSGLATDWYGSFTGLPAGSANLKVTYKGKNCGSTTATTCATLTSNPPQQTVKICDWTVGGAAGCATATSAGWRTLDPPPTQPQGVGSTPEVSSTWTAPAPAASFIGTGSYKGQVRVLVHTQRWTSSAPTAFSTWANLMTITYDAP